MVKAKITIIGGGSRQWAIGMLKDLTRQNCLVPHVCLYDINIQAALENEKVAHLIFEANGAKNYTVSVSETLDEALRGSDFVIISIEPGHIGCRYGDLEIPDSYGILQTVGDTTGPGGIMRARRAIPLFLDFARAIERCCPKAWVINYTNPMTLCTAALFRGFPGIKALGCCHEVFHIETFLAQMCRTWYGAELDRRDIDVDVSGVNHFTFMSKATWNGHDLIEKTREYIKDPAVFADHTEYAIKNRNEEKWFDCDRVVALSFLRDYGVLGAAGDRHLSEFVPFILTSEENVLRCGITRTPYWWRVKSDREKKAHVFTKEELIAQPNDEEGVDIILSLLGERRLHTNVNTLNRGQVPYLPVGHVTESMADISCDSIAPVTALRLTAQVEAFEQHIADEQALVLDAVCSGDDEKLLEAMCMDPLCSSLSKEQISRMFRKMQYESALRY